MRKDKFKNFPGVIPNLDLVEEADKITHQINLEDDLECEEDLNIFKFDEKFAEKEEEWDEIKKEIVGDYFDKPADDSMQDSDSSDENVSLRII